MKYVYAPKLSFESERLYPQVSLRSNYETEVTLFFFSLRNPLIPLFVKSNPCFFIANRGNNYIKVLCIFLLISILTLIIYLQ